MFNWLRRDDANALVVVAFYFQYGLAIPFAVMVGNQSPIVLMTAVLLLYAVGAGQIRLNFRVLLLLLLPLIALLCKAPFEYTFEDGNVVQEMLVSFLTIGTAGIILGTLRFSFERFLHYAYHVAWVNLALIFYVPFTGLYGETVNYMRFGYAILPTVLVAFYFSVNWSRRYWGAPVMLLVSFAELLVYGARGSLLVALLFFALYFLVLSRLRWRAKAAVVLAISAFVYLAFGLLDRLVGLIDSMGIDSYSITKLLYLYEGKSLAESSSGRDDIWSAAIDRFLTHPWLGSPINSSLLDTGASYYHNIFLDVAVNFGVIGVIVFVSALVLLIHSAFASGDYRYKCIVLLFFLVPFGRLFVSSSFWQRPEFWFFLSFCLCQKVKLGSGTTAENPAPHNHFSRF